MNLPDSRTRLPRTDVDGVASVAGPAHLNGINRRHFIRGVGAFRFQPHPDHGCERPRAHGLHRSRQSRRQGARGFLEWGDSQTVAVCDLHDDYLDLAVRKSRGTPQRYKDYRRLLERKDVDAVMIATPDHWHALMFIDACRTGKDVYIERPLSLTVVEGRKMVETAERTGGVVQVGTPRRSAAVVKEAVDFVRSGGIGQVTCSRCCDIQNEWPNGIGNFPDDAPPTAWEWDQWLGPAAKVPYSPNRAFYARSGVGRVQDIIDAVAELKSMLRALWPAENRPYYLDSLLVRYDAELQYWQQKRRLFAEIREAKTSVPPADRLGLYWP